MVHAHENSNAFLLGVGHLNIHIRSFLMIRDTYTTQKIVDRMSNMPANATQVGGMR